MGVFDMIKSSALRRRESEAVKSARREADAALAEVRELRRRLEAAVEEADVAYTELFRLRTALLAAVGGQPRRVDSSAELLAALVEQRDAALRDLAASPRIGAGDGR